MFCVAVVAELMSLPSVPIYLTSCLEMDHMTKVPPTIII